MVASTPARASRRSRGETGSRTSAAITATKPSASAQSAGATPQRLMAHPVGAGTAIVVACSVPWNSALA